MECINNTVLSLDLGTKTGWAIDNVDGITSSGTKDFKVEKNQTAGVKFLRFFDWLSELNANNNQEISMVFYEQVMSHNGVKAAHAYGGFLGTLLHWCALNEIDCTGVHVGTIKKFIAGNGKASKEDVKEAVRVLGFDPIDDNEADAIALLQYALDGTGL